MTRDGRAGHAWARAAIAALLALARPAPAHAQVSPGPLARAHASLEGNSNCFRCHTRAQGGEDALSRACLACHTEIAELRTAGRGLHARVTQPCARCHPDHGGVDFALIAWDEGSPERFDHARTGYRLTGKHATLACRDCHRAAFQTRKFRTPHAPADPARTWLGLATACASCHADAHGGQLGTACQRCHDTVAWKPAPGFDHARTGYPLTGRHAAVACEKCHLAPGLAAAQDAQGRPIPRWKPLPHTQCAPCHADPHAGRLGGDCAHCHNTDGFERIMGQAFDHDRTRFPLRGAHAALACGSCHDATRAWGPHPKFARCDDCHRDAHAGLATLRGAGADCDACHGVSSFRTTTYTVAAHRSSAFPLDGAHAATACDGCHVRRAGAEGAALGTSRVLMRPPHGACEDCHADPHGGRFAAGGERPRAHGCVDCHGMDRFRPSRFDASAHATAAFRLEGAHRAVPCTGCHAELSAAPAASSLRDAPHRRALSFRSPHRQCADCHGQPHGAQFAHRGEHGACEDCHDQAAFSPATRFDHARDAGFRLEGAHARTPCASCHRRARDTDGVVRTIWHPVDARCESCHTATGARAPDAPVPSALAGLVPEVTHASRAR